MKITENHGMKTIDGSGTFTLTKNDYGFSLNEGVTWLAAQNFTMFTCLKGNRLSATIAAIRFIWSK